MKRVSQVVFIHTSCRYFVTLSALLCLSMSCGCTSLSSRDNPREFPRVEAPAIYTDAVARTEYLAMHYWDRFDFSDTFYIGSGAVITEQALVDYFTMLPYASYPVICAGIKRMMDGASSHEAMYAFFTSQSEHYLYGNGSPIRNEEFYIPILEHMVASLTLIEARKTVPRAMLEVLQKNRPDTRAADIHFTLSNGTKSSLYELHSEFILIFFHNPDCKSCQELSGRLKNSELLTSLQHAGRLKIVAIYPGTDLDTWRKHLGDFPAQWINGYDHNEEIYGEETYIIRSTPALYLLDRTFRVLMKEPPFDYVEYYFKNF